MIMNIKARIKILNSNILISYDNLNKFKKDLNYYLDKYGLLVQVYTYDYLFQMVANDILLDYAKRCFE